MPEPLANSYIAAAVKADEKYRNPLADVILDRLRNREVVTMQWQDGAEVELKGDFPPALNPTGKSRIMWRILTRSISQGVISEGRALPPIVEAIENLLFAGMQAKEG